MLTKRNNKCLLFACIEKNIGDDLFIKMVCDRYPNTTFIISNSANYGSFCKMKNLRFSKLIERFLNVSNSEPSDWLRRIKRKILVVLYKTIIGKYDNCVYIVGNAFKNYYYNGKIQSEWIKDRIAISKNFYLLSTNFGPYSDERWKKDFESIFPMMSDVCFRDYSSYALFNNLKNIRYRPDAIFSMGRKKRINHQNKTLLISMIDCFMSGRPDEISKYGEIYEKKMSEIASGYLKNGYDVIFLNSNKKQDYIATKRVMDTLYKYDKTSVFNYEGDIEDFLDLYGKIDYVIATRLHPIICSFLFDLPIIPIVYDKKVYGVLNSCNFNGSFFDLSTIEHLSFEKTFAILNNYTFKLQEEIINSANEQFLEVDKVLMPEG